MYPHAGCAVHLQLTIHLQLSIRMLDVHLIEELHSFASRILLPFGAWRVLILELAAGWAGTEKTLDCLDWWCELVMRLDLGS